ncbi:hypothetical protein BB559_000387 [Furculomyces boomerangus]|uniref:Uncharacterized protein n=2 Tax=Harpellales TaxID=61421 RepID=A0A2T9Z5K0_9FUNG|nr:hypothetical protein BB559_000387 [Furculomyces boomerangus]PVZ99229.1 hypothetical protein BB558_004762 [Smittium angustum]
MSVFINGKISQPKFFLDPNLDFIPEKTVLLLFPDSLALAGFHSTLILLSTLYSNKTHSGSIIKKAHFDLFKDSETESSIHISAKHINTDIDGDLTLLNVHEARSPFTVCLISKLPKIQDLPDFMLCITEFFGKNGVKDVIVPNSTYLKNHKTELFTCEIDPNVNYDLQIKDFSPISNHIYSIISSFCYLGNIKTQFILYSDKKPANISKYDLDLLKDNNNHMKEHRKAINSVSSHLFKILGIDNNIDMSTENLNYELHYTKLPGLVISLPSESMYI